MSSPISLGSNINSLKAQTRLSSATASQSEALQRLSSGLRINKAADDSAGLAISESLLSSKRVFSQGIRNINDGISLISIADNTLEQLSGIVVRIKELAEQSANGAYSAKQRAALNVEAQELSEEYYRISREASFNGKNIFDGSISDGVRIQAGFGLDGSVFSSLGRYLGAGTFNAGSSYYGAGANSEDVAIADINGDTFDDLITVGSGEVTIRLGNGDGSLNGPNLSSFRTYSVAGVGLRSVSLEDLNSDGILDIVAGGTLGGNGVIGVLLGNGDGTFDSAATFQTTLTSILDIALEDLNGDGNLDLVATGSGSTSSHLGNGQGTFATGVTISSSLTSLNALALGDINGDGIIDLVRAGTNGGTGGYEYLRGRGDGTFFAGVGIPTETTNVQDVKISDLNNDGILDIITAGQSGASGNYTVRIGTGGGSFATGVSYQMNAASSLYELEIGDYDGDGNKDIAAVSLNGTLSVSSGNGNGTFGAVSSITGISVNLSTLAQGDLNGDGVIDLIAGGTPGGAAPFVYVISGNTREGLAPLLPFDISDSAYALQALGHLSHTGSNLSLLRSQLGAFESRLAVATENLRSASENFAAAASRIKDADIAEETSNLVRLSILRDSATAILAQANLTPTLALGLLGAE